MNVITPHARLVRINGGIADLQHGTDALRWIEHCGRISHRAEEAQTVDSWMRFIPAVVMQKGDWSIVEHAFATVESITDRGVTHELVRHRIASYTQESTRFVNYSKKILPSFVYPRPQDDVRHPAWVLAIIAIEKAYQELITDGWTPQEARSVFPNALASLMVTTENLRSWRWFFIMRTTKEAHPQMKEVTIPLLAEFKSKIPLIYDDIEPNARQADNLRLPK